MAKLVYTPEALAAALPAGPISLVPTMGALHAGHIPGYPASHGCIRLTNWDAQAVAAAARLATDRRA